MYGGASVLIDCLDQLFEGKLDWKQVAKLSVSRQKVLEKAAEAIFDRFTKLNDFVQGTGLGLSICREIADKMGGRVYLDTTYTAGARFVLSLPLNPPA